MSDNEKFCCADCLKYVPSLNTCPHCGSFKTILASVALEFGATPEHAEAEECECSNCGGDGVCPECGGTGEITDTCYTCGREEEVDCPECWGAGECVKCEGDGKW